MLLFELFNAAVAMPVPSAFEVDVICGIKATNLSLQHIFWLEGREERRCGIWGAQRWSSEGMVTKSSQKDQEIDGQCEAWPS